MKRVLTITLSVATFASVANAEIPPGTAAVWIQAPDGGNTINLLISETGIIQLWMEYTADPPGPGEAQRMVAMSVGLEHLIEYGHDFEVVLLSGFEGLSGAFSGWSRGPLDDPPDGVPDVTGVGNLSYYELQAWVDPPYSESMGVAPFEGAVLLDEIIIHGVSDTGSTPNRVIFDPGNPPQWAEAFFYDGSWELHGYYDFTLGTGAHEDNPLYVHVVGEPPPPLGACCDLTGFTCYDDTLEVDCQEPGSQWTGDTACADLDPPCAPAPAVDIETVTVGNPGNPGELSGEGAGGYGPDRICGAVDYAYNIGKYEVTNAQYCEFLNAVAASDPHGLYHSPMGSSPGGITRSGSSGNYTYSTIAGRANMPVTNITFYNALRFANWMHNGQGSGDTEDGAYDMSLGPSVARKPDAQVFLPTEDEWYKAAYYKGGGTDAGYWDYPAETDDPNPPTAEAPPGTDTTYGSANYDGEVLVDDLTDVGAYTFKPPNGSVGAYGTFDQAGNLWEWNETDLYGDGSRRGLRGGGFTSIVDALHAATRPTFGHPEAAFWEVGFRVAEVAGPECIDPPSDMVAWWPLDEPVGPIAHDIVGSNHGTHVDGPTPVPAGMVDGALSFDGTDDYVEVWDDGALDFGMGEGTIDAWIKTNADAGAIVVKGSYLWYYFDVVSDGHLWFGICDDAYCYMPAETAGTVNDGYWHHVAATLSRSGEGEVTEVTLDIYIDGVWDGTIYHADVGYLGSPDQELLIGARRSVPGYLYGFFDGVMDEVEIFNRALAPEEIQAIFDAGSAGKCKPPDCNTNGVPDDQDIAEGTSEDCQPNEVPDECDIAAGASQDAGGDGVPDECQRIQTARSCYTHGTAGELCLDIGTGGTGPARDNVEPRLQGGGAPELELQCSRNVSSNGASVLVSCIPDPYGGTAAVIADGSDTARVQFSGMLPDQSCCTLVFTGDIQDCRTIVMLVGDVNFDCAVSTADASSIKARLGDLVDESNFWYDVNRDGFISVADRSSIKARFENLAPCPCTCP